MKQTLARRLLFACTMAMGLPAGFTSTAAEAQALPPAVHVGMSSDELQSAGLDLHRAARPERMPNGARGLWQQNGVAGEDGLVFEATYFIRGGAVDRIDLQLSEAPDGIGAAYERIVGTLRAQYGSELRSRESAGAMISETASWAAGSQDVAAYLSGSREAEKVRVIYRRRELKDAATL